VVVQELLAMKVSSRASLWICGTLLYFTDLFS